MHPTALVNTNEPGTKFKFLAAVAPFVDELEKPDYVTGKGWNYSACFPFPLLFIPHFSVGCRYM